MSTNLTPSLTPRPTVAQPVMVPTPGQSLPSRPNTSAPSLPTISLPPRSPQREAWLKRRRSTMDVLVTGASILSTAVVLVPLIAILGYLIFKGASSLNVAFFTHVPAPVGEAGGGMANAIVGSAIVLGIASSMGIPLGIGAGVFLAEYGRGGIFGNIVRFTADVLNGVPSIVMGISAYALIVSRQHHFSAFAGGVALAIMMVPTITRTTEEMLATVPSSLREAAFGLGVPKWRTILSISLPRHHHRLHAGLCPRGRGDGTAAVYGPWQPILVSQGEPTHRGPAAADLYLCRVAL